MAVKTNKLEMPTYRRAHTDWVPKVKNKDGMLSVKCGSARVTSTSMSDLVATVDTYAKAHGWEKVA